MEITESIVRKAPKQLAFRRKLRRIYKSTALLHLKDGRPQQAIEGLDLALAQQKHLKQTTESDKLSLSEIYRGKGLALKALDRRQEAIASYQAAAEICSTITKWYGPYNQACVLSPCIELAPDQAAAEEFSGRAIRALQRAVELGLNKVNFLKDSADLESIRALPEFQALVRQLEAR